MGRRLFAAAVVPPAVVACWFTTALLVLTVAVTSSPFTPEGDPCCSAGPETWAEVLHAVPWVVGFAIADGLLLSGALWGFMFAAAGFVRRKRWLTVLPLFLVLAGLTTIGLALYPTREDPRWDQQDSPGHSRPETRRQNGAPMPEARTALKSSGRAVAGAQSPPVTRRIAPVV
jgi:hypothetical protein